MMPLTVGRRRRDANFWSIERWWKDKGFESSGEPDEHDLHKLDALALLVAVYHAEQRKRHRALVELLGEVRDAAGSQCP